VRRRYYACYRALVDRVLSEVGVVWLSELESQSNARCRGGNLYPNLLPAGAGQAVRKRHRLHAARPRDSENWPVVLVKDGNQDRGFAARDRNWPCAGPPGTVLWSGSDVDAHECRLA